MAVALGRAGLRPALAPGALRRRDRRHGSEGRHKTRRQIPGMDTDPLAWRNVRDLSHRPLGFRRALRQQRLASGMSAALLQGRVGQRRRDGPRGRESPRNQGRRRGGDPLWRSLAFRSDAPIQWSGPGSAPALARLRPQACWRDRRRRRLQRRAPAHNVVTLDLGRMSVRRIGSSGRLSPATAGLFALEGKAEELAPESEVGAKASTRRQWRASSRPGRPQSATPMRGPWSSTRTLASAATLASSPASRKTTCLRSGRTKSAGAAICIG